ncbi:MAG: hypothetical protein ACHQ1D_08205, partial [Nitrososphaerales archaeon]
MKFIITLVGMITLLTTGFIFPTTINGRFVVTNTTATKCTILLQINTNTGVDDFGGATILFGFDPNAINISNTPVEGIDYIFHNFDGSPYSAATITKPKQNQIWVNIDLPFYNNNNGTIVAGEPTWTNVVSLTFNIVNPNIPRGLCWYLTSSFWGIYDANNTTLWENGVFEGNFGLTVEINNDWNVVSVPGINPDGQGVNDWWIGRNQDHNVYRFKGGFLEPVQTTQPGEGYWMFHDGTKVYNTGDEWPAEGIQRVPNEPINLPAGWNLIGGYENIVQADQIITVPPGLISAPIYTYSDQYIITSTIEPGHGYMLKMDSPGQINFSNGLSRINGQDEIYIQDNWGKITFTDASKRSYSLYLVTNDVDLNLYDLPPTPPENLFDIRFGSGRIAECLDNGIQSIEMKGVDYP